MIIKEIDYEDNCQCICDRLSHWESAGMVEVGYSTGNDFKDVFNAEDVSASLSFSVIGNDVKPVFEFAIIDDSKSENERRGCFSLSIPINYCPFCGRHLSEKAAYARKTYMEDKQ